MTTSACAYGVKAIQALIAVAVMAEIFEKGTDNKNALRQSTKSSRADDIKGENINRETQDNRGIPSVAAQRLLVDQDANALLAYNFRFAQLRALAKLYYSRYALRF